MTPADPLDLARFLDDLLRSRRSVRAYRPDPVPRITVLEILQAASAAPSNSNTQPWRVHVVAGRAQRELADALVTAFEQDTLPPSPHFPDPLPAEFAERQADFARRYYGCLGIPRDDAAARARQTLRNFSFFGAPVGLIFTIDARLTQHSWLDLGLFVQGVMLAARARGLDTCPQVSFARFHPVIAPRLRMGEHEVTACGMSLGHADPAAVVNGIDMPRLQAESFVSFSGFDD
jgi:nitroreductase